VLGATFSTSNTIAYTCLRTAEVDEFSRYTMQLQPGRFAALLALHLGALAQSPLPQSPNATLVLLSSIDKGALSLDGSPGAVYV
jgi:hypothetical protein